MVAGGDRTLLGAQDRSDDVIVAASRGLPLVIVGAVLQHDPEALLVRESSAVKTLADLNGRSHLFFGFSEASDAHGTSCATSLREIGKRVERCLRGAEMIDQRAKRRGADILASNQAQPRQPLCIGKRNAARLN